VERPSRRLLLRRCFSSSCSVRPACGAPAVDALRGVCGGSPVRSAQCRRVVYLLFAGLSGAGDGVIDTALDGEPVIEPLAWMKRIAALPGGVRRGLSVPLGNGEDRIGELFEQVAQRPSQSTGP
jgi:hypothetical protein